MTNVIAFPRKKRIGGVEARTSDLSEALWMIAFLLHDHEQFVFDAAANRVTLIDEFGRPDPTVFGPDPEVVFAGQRQPAMPIVDMGRTIEAGTPLPTHMLIFFAIWNRDDPEDPVLTYGDAIEMMEASLDIIQWERDEYFKKQGGAQ